MFGKIVYMSNTTVHVERSGAISTDIMNMHVVFTDKDTRILGEVEDISEEIIKIRLLGEFTNDRFLGGVIRKPSMNSEIRLITKEELPLIFGGHAKGNFLLGRSPLYDNYPIMGNVNDIFSGHSAILGNSGSGKSWGVARIIQNLFYDQNVFPGKSNILLIDAYGEYRSAFGRIHEVSPNYNFKYYTTDKTDTGGEKLRIPLWLLDVDDIALLLQATNSSQLLIIEKVLKLCYIFAMDNEVGNKYKNHLIAKAIMSILFSNETASSKKNEVFNLLQNCNTNEFNMHSKVQGVGYVREFKDLFLINTNGSFSESVLLNEYVNSFIDDALDSYEAPKRNKFNIIDLEKALNFALISEGVLHNEDTYSDGILLKVKMHSLVIGPYKEFFDYEDDINTEGYILKMFSNGTAKTQIVNLSLEDIDDWFAKFITKMFVKMLFNYSRELEPRASMPFHVFIEEAHRYVKNGEIDSNLLGYNIFERVSKEGRKYGMLITLISQRPVDLSENVISQISNFIIFKLNHPRDLEYIKQMLPNISSDIVEKQKTLQPGTCVAFGTAFKIPLIIKMDKPNPTPSSSSCDVFRNWYIGN